MRIYPKTLLTLGATFVCLFIILFITTDHIIGNSYASLENEELSKNVARAKTVIEFQSLIIDSTCSALAPLNDTFYYVHGQNKLYIEKNFGSESLDNMQVNMILFYNSSGTLYNALGYDLNAHEKKEVPSSLLEYIASN